MNLSEMDALADWVYQHVVRLGLVERYDGLLHKFREMSKGEPSSFREETEELEYRFRLIEEQMVGLNQSQLEILRAFGIEPYIGRKGLIKLEDLLFREGLNIDEVKEELSAAIRRLSEGLKRIANIQTALDGVNLKGPEYSSEESIIRIYFAGGAGIKNIVDLKTWGNKWHEIGRGIAMAHDKAPESVRITGAGQGSLYIELAAFSAFALTIARASKTISEALKNYYEAMKFRAEANRIYNEDEDVQKLLEQKEKEIHESIVEKVVSTIKEQIQSEREITQDALKPLDYAVRNLVSFYEGGGDLEFINAQLMSAENEEQGTTFFELTREIRMLREQTKLLEHDSQNQQPKENPDSTNDDAD